MIPPVVEAKAREYTLDQVGLKNADTWFARATYQTFLDAVEWAADEAARGVRLLCSACGGDGHAHGGTECEYCGRPMRAVRVTLGGDL